MLGGSGISLLVRGRLEKPSCEETGRGKRQASSLTAGEGYCRMNLERNNYD